MMPAVGNMTGVPSPGTGTSKMAEAAHSLAMLGCKRECNRPARGCRDQELARAKRGARQ